MPTKPTRISEHVLQRAELCKSRLEAEWKVTLDMSQVLDHLLSTAMDEMGVEDVAEPPPAKAANI